MELPWGSAGHVPRFAMPPRIHETRKTEIPTWSEVTI